MSESEKNPTPEAQGAKLADMIVEAEAVELPSSAWLKIGVMAILFSALCVVSHQYRTLFKQWLGDSNWTHGFIIPLFSLYLIYVRWDKIVSAPRRVCLWGLPLLIAGIAMMLLALFPGQNRWGSQLSMIVTILGIVLYLAGPRVTLLTLVPIVYLALCMPLPAGIYESIALKLQNFAAMISGGILKILGVEITVTASNLQIISVSGQYFPVQVAEACSGVRSLMAFLALGVAIAYIEDRPLWQRIVLILSGLPIAIACNVLRVTVTSAMYVLDEPELGKDFMHFLAGMVLLIPALLLFLGLGKLLDCFYIEEEVEEDEGTENAETDSNGDSGEVTA